MEKPGCKDRLILIFIIGLIFIGIISGLDCYTQPNIGNAPGYCMLFYK